MNASAVNYTKGIYNPAGVIQIYYALAADIATFPVLADPGTATTLSSLVEYSDAITMATGKQFWPLYSTLETAELKSTLSGVRDGKGRENSLDISYPGNDSNFLGFDAIAPYNDFVFLIKEKNGKLRVLGSLDDPAYLDTDTATSGAKVADARTTKMSFKAPAETACPIYTMDISTLLVPAVA
jgi:hypothetical protein